MTIKSRLAVLVSGNGSNLQAILDAAEEPAYPAEVALVLSNRPQAFALERARRANVPAAVIPHQDFPTREAFEKELIKKIKEARIDLVILAGFMRVLTPFFVGQFPSRILNIHPSLLPAFPGTHAIQKAWDAGVDITGVTVHFVDEGTDKGPVLFQEKVPVAGCKTVEELEKKIHQVEHKIFPETIRRLVQGDRA